MRPYAFTTVWHVRAPIERVWDALQDPERWWPGLRRDGARFIWKGWLPYTLTAEIRTVRREEPHVLEVSACGALEGRGAWRLDREPDGTRVRYDWRVATRVRWMRWLGPVGRPVFRWNHDVVMRRGARGLKRLVERAGSMDRQQDALQERILHDADPEDAQHQGGQQHLRQVAHGDR